MNLKGPVNLEGTPGARNSRPHPFSVPNFYKRRNQGSEGEVTCSGSYIVPIYGGTEQYNSSLPDMPEELRSQSPENLSFYEQRAS